MSTAAASSQAVNARIVYWGPEKSGKSASLRCIHSKLRADHRGDLREVPTRLDPSVTYEMLPIELGEIKGSRTQIRVISVPGGPAHAATRKQLLDGADGVVFVADAQVSRVEDNLKSFAELTQCLEDYGRSLADVPIVVQYNKRDLSDSFAMEEIHRQLQLTDAAVFESSALDGAGVLQTLTTISKGVVRSLRDRDPESLALARAAAAAPAPPPAAPATELEVDPPDLAPPTSQELMENAILLEGEELEGAELAGEALESGPAETTVEAPSLSLDPGFEPAAKPGQMLPLGPDLRIVSVGSATRSGQRSVRVPLVLGNDDGECASLVLTIQLDPSLDGDET